MADNRVPEALQPDYLRLAAWVSRKLHEDNVGDLPASLRAGALRDHDAAFADGDGHWVTIDGQHVLIGKGGTILEGGSHLGYETGSAKDGESPSAEKAQATWRGGLSKSQVAELELYQSTGYRGLNEALRSGDKGMIHDRAQRIARMDAALKNAYTDQPMTVYRLVTNSGVDEETGKNQDGMSSLLAIPQGATFTDPGYVSTATDNAWISRYGPGAGDVSPHDAAIASIHVPAHTNAAYLGGDFLSTGAGEHELLIARGATFRVVSHSSDAQGVRHVGLELVHGRE